MSVVLPRLAILKCGAFVDEKGHLGRQSGNPIPHVSRELGIDPYVCSDALHQIKQAAGLGPRDATVIYDNGDVVDAETSEEIGNLHDEG